MERAAPHDNEKWTSLLVWTKTRLKRVADRGINVEDLVKGSRSGEAVTLLCGERSGPHYRRKDGLKLNFEINLEQTSGGLRILSYVLHAQAPESARPRFLRWEFERERKQGVNAIREPLAPAMTTFAFPRRFSLRGSCWGSS